MRRHDTLPVSAKTLSGGPYPCDPNNLTVNSKFRIIYGVCEWIRTIFPVFENRTVKTQSDFAFSSPLHKIWFGFHCLDPIEDPKIRVRVTICFEPIPESHSRRWPASDPKDLLWADPEKSGSRRSKDGMTRIDPIQEGHRPACIQTYCLLLKSKVS